MNPVFDLVIFGGNGDLSMRKLMPAMYYAFNQNLCPENSRILVCCRQREDFESVVEQIKNALQKHTKGKEFSESRWDSFKELLVPVLLDLTDINKGWQEFSEQFVERDSIVRVFYLAVMPSIYGACCENLSNKNLITKQSRIVVEKPLGYDYETAEAINQTMARYFDESQIYRIDHYLGKETVQNLLALRFSNFLFENIWDSKSIDHIQISLCEQVGLEGRGEFYDGAGAMRDMVQNHLLQLLCLVSMESPNKLKADDVRYEKIKVLNALRSISQEKITRSVVRGQYVSGLIGDQNVPGYLDELGNFESTTETFVAIRAFIDNWRWAGVPFYLRTGKRLKERKAQIIVQFKSVTHNVYPQMQKNIVPNRLVIELQPDEKIRLQLMAKDLTRDTDELKPISLNLDSSSSEVEFKTTAYQRLLLDAIAGNSTLFIHRDEVKAAWRWVDPIIQHWQKTNESPELYSAGSWGPSKANELFKRHNQGWIND